MTSSLINPYALSYMSTQHTALSATYVHMYVHVVQCKATIRLMGKAVSSRVGGGEAMASQAHNGGDHIMQWEDALVAPLD